jgi:hypothetical protein
LPESSWVKKKVTKSRYLNWKKKKKTCPFFETSVFPLVNSALWRQTESIQCHIIWHLHDSLRTRTTVGFLNQFIITSRGDPVWNTFPELRAFRTRWRSFGWDRKIAGVALLRFLNVQRPWAPSIGLFLPFKRNVKWKMLERDVKQ